MPSDTSTPATPPNHRGDPDEEYFRLAEVVPGGFGGAYLDSESRVVVVLVDPTQREAALLALESLTGDDYRNARVVKGDFDFAQLTRYYDRLLANRLGRLTTLSDIDEGLNRVRLGVEDEETRERVAREIVDLSDVPCGAVVIVIAGVAVPRI